MAASMATTISVAGSVVSLPSGSTLSSSSAFGLPFVSVAPLKSVAKRHPLVARAAISEEQSGRTARREMLAGLLAAGAAFVSAGSALAATGPGGSGAQRTNEKAGDLLKAADELTTNDSPERFGPGRTGTPDESGKLAGQAGAGAVPGLQDPKDAEKGAKGGLEEMRANFNKVFNKGSSDLSEASAFDVPADSDQLDVSSATEKVKSDIAGSEVGVENSGTTFQNKLSSAKDTTDSLVSDAQSKADDTKDKASGGSDIFSGLVDKVKGALPQ